MNEYAETNITILDNPSQLRSNQANIQALYANAFNNTLSDDSWRHFYLQAPLGCAKSFVCYVDNTLIAHGGIIPQQLSSVTGQTYDYFLQTAIMIEKRYRNLSVFCALLNAIQQYVDERDTFVLAFPNDNSYLPFTKILKWRPIREYSIQQYKLNKDSAQNESRDSSQIDFDWQLHLDARFLKWRSELNDMRRYEKKHNFIFYKEYNGALDLLDMTGENVSFMEVMVDLNYKYINIPECFLPYGSTSGLTYMQDVGIRQRMCVYPANNSTVYYQTIKPSLLLSDVF